MDSFQCILFFHLHESSVSEQVAQSPKLNISYFIRNKEVGVLAFVNFRHKDGRVTMIGGGNLQILNVRLATSGNPDSDDAAYMCRASNDVDSVDAEARLTVLGNDSH